MKYYLHDTSAFDDEKIGELFISFGYEGLGLFYTALEKIAKQEKPIKTSVLKSQLKVGKKLEKRWKFIESLGLLQSKDGYTFNEELLNFSKKYQLKNEKNAKRISEWRSKQVVQKNVTSTEQVSNAPKVNESKVKQSKVNDIEERKLKFALTLEPFIDKYGREMITDFYKYWSESMVSGKKFLQETKKTWDVSLRLERWSKNNFNTKQNGKTESGQAVSDFITKP